MSFEYKSYQHFHNYVSKILKTKNLYVDEYVLSEITAEFYYFTQKQSFDFVCYKFQIRDPKSVLTWRVSKNLYENGCEFVEDAKELMKQYNFIFNGNYEERELYPDLYKDESIPDYIIDEDGIINGKSITKKFREDMRNIRYKPGVYFLYNSNKKLIYIGKSHELGCRIPSSVKERQSHFYSYGITKTASDCGIYEMYYISKNKPKKEC